jgi:hypothetical protein
MTRIKRVYHLPPTGKVSSASIDPLDGSFANYLARTLVFPEPEKDRLPKAIIARPLRELDLADHHRLDPMTPFHFRGSQSLVPTAPAGGQCR